MDAKKFFKLVAFMCLKVWVITLAALFIADDLGIIRRE
jgi:hypothetical protein